jgi:hypothetical protein
MTTETAFLHDVGEQVRSVEARLERLVASGWRNAAAEAADLAEAAAALDELGLAALAERLRRVVAAADGAAALPAIALSLSACHQLRARLAADRLQPGDWSPLAPPRRQAAQTPARLIPVGRMAVGREEVWACIRLRGQWTDECFLVDSSSPNRPAGDTLDGEAAAGGPANNGPDRLADEPPWLRCIVEGRLAWQARYPLGASGEVERCRLAGGNVVGPSDAEAHALAALLQALGKPYKDGATVLSGTGGLRLRHLERAEAGTYVWPDPAAAAAFAGVRDEKAWALTWVEGATIRPLALLSPPGFFKHPALIHLVPGLPQTPLN